MIIFVNNKFVSDDKPCIYSNDRGLLLADGIFTTLKAINNKLIHFEKHYARLTLSAKSLKIPFNYTETQLKEICYKLLNLNSLMQQIAVLRITLTRGRASRGINILTKIDPTLLITTNQYIKPTINNPRFCITSSRRNEFSLIKNLKTLNYTESILAREEAITKGFDDGIILNTKSLICCGMTSNLFFVQNDQVITPPLEDGIIQGIIRACVISLCNSLSVEVIQRSIEVGEIANFSEAFHTNCLLDIQSIACIDLNNFNVDQIKITDLILKKYVSLYMT